MKKSLFLIGSLLISGVAMADCPSRLNPNELAKCLNNEVADTLTSPAEKKTLTQAEPDIYDKIRIISKDHSQSGEFCQMLTSQVIGFQNLYKSAYHGEMPLSSAQENVNQSISSFYPEENLVKLLLLESFKVKSSIFSGEDNQIALYNYEYNFFQTCKANFETLKMGNPADRNIDYSQLK